MQKNIPLRGLTTTPSAHDCADGDIAAMLNLLPEDGALKPLHSPYTIGEIEDKAQLWVHETPDYLHYIKRLDSGKWYWADGANGLPAIGAVEEDEDEEDDTPSDTPSGDDSGDTGDTGNTDTPSEPSTTPPRVYHSNVYLVTPSSGWKTNPSWLAEVIDVATPVITAEVTSAADDTSWMAATGKVIVTDDDSLITVETMGNADSNLDGKVIISGEVQSGYGVTMYTQTYNGTTYYVYEMPEAMVKFCGSSSSSSSGSSSSGGTTSGGTSTGGTSTGGTTTGGTTTGGSTSSGGSSFSDDDGNTSSGGSSSSGSSSSGSSSTDTPPQAPPVPPVQSDSKTGELEIDDEENAWTEITGITGTPTSLAYNGNVLIIACENQPIQYVIWKDDDYAYLGQLPELEMEFKLEGSVVARNYVKNKINVKKTTEGDENDEAATYTDPIHTFITNQYRPTLVDAGFKCVSRIQWETLQKWGLQSGVQYYVRADRSNSVLQMRVVNNATTVSSSTPVYGSGSYVTFSEGNVLEFWGTVTEHQKFGTQIPDGTYTIYSNTAEKADTDAGYYAENTSDNMDAVKGVCSQFYRLFSEEKGKFVCPFFVRYSLKLKTEDMVYSSSPELIVPNWGVTPRLMLRSDDMTNYYLQAQAFICDFYCRIRKMTGIDIWNDLISEIVISVTPPISFIDMEKEWVEGIYSVRAHANKEETFKDNFEIGGDSKVLLYNNLIDASNALCVIDPPVFDKYAFTKHMQSRMQSYYKIHGIKPSEAEIGVWSKINAYGYNIMYPEAGIAVDFSGVISRDIQASKVLVYNGRTHLMNVKTHIEKDGFALSPTTKMDGKDYTYRMKLEVKKDGKKHIVCSDIMTGDPSCALYFFCNDSDAYQVTVYRNAGGTVTKATIKLENHEYISGAYAYLIEDITWSSSTAEEMNATATVSAIPHPNEIYVSKADNPFSFPAANAVQVGRGEIRNMAVNTEAVSEGQFGDAPLYVMTDEETWLLSTASTGVYEAKQPLTGAACINPESICQLPNSVVFCTANGIMLAQGKQMTCISDVLRDMVSDITLPHLGEVMAAKDLANHGDALKEYVYDEDWLTFLKTCGIAYDNVNERILVYPKDSDLTFVYSLRSQMWGMQQLDIEGNIAKANNCWVIRTEGTGDDKKQVVYDINKTGTQTQYENQFLITRPLGLDAPDVLKRIRTMIARGYFRKGNVAVAMYGSRDLFNWRLIWTSKDQYLRGFSGTPYKYYSVVLVCSLRGDERLQGLDFDYDSSMANQLR